METVIAAGSVVTVVGAVFAILIPVVFGDSQQRRLQQIKGELLAQQGTDPKAATPPADAKR